MDGLFEIEFVLLLLVLRRELLFGLLEEDKGRGLVWLGEEDSLSKYCFSLPYLASGLSGVGVGARRGGTAWTKANIFL